MRKFIEIFLVAYKFHRTTNQWHPCRYHSTITNRVHRLCCSVFSWHFVDELDNRKQVAQTTMDLGLYRLQSNHLYKYSQSLTVPPAQNPWAATPNDTCDIVRDRLPSGLELSCFCKSGMPVPRHRSTMLNRTLRPPRTMRTIPRTVACRRLKGFADAACCWSVCIPVSQILYGSYKLVSVAVTKKLHTGSNVIGTTTNIAMHLTATGWMNKWMNEWMNEWMNGWMNEDLVERMRRTRRVLTDHLLTLTLTRSHAYTVHTERDTYNKIHTKRQVNVHGYS